MERKPVSFHLKYWGIIFSVIAGGGAYHATHPLIHTINKALNTVDKASKIDLEGHIGCVPAGLKGNI